MSEGVRDELKPDPPSPWRLLSHVSAVCLELAIIAVFVRDGALLGVCFWFAYFYWSATRALVARALHRED